MTPGKASEMSGFSQFVALLYKQLLLRKRNYFGTAFEIIFPIIIASIPCMLYDGLPGFDAKIREGFRWINFTTYKPIDPMTEYGDGIHRNIEFVYAPSNDVTDTLMSDSIRVFFGPDFYSDPVKKNSEEELKNYIRNETIWNEDKILIGTVFKGISDGLPADLDYKIYFPQRLNTQQKYVLNEPTNFVGYRQNYFLQWQTSIGDTFIRSKSIELNKNIDYKIFLQTFPYPGYWYTPILIITQTVETCIHLGLMLFVAAIVKRIIEERNDGSKELMDSMGMTKCSYWASTFTNNFTTAFIITLVISIIYKASIKDSLFYTLTHFLILLFILLLFMANLILFCMTFSIFFNRVAYAVCGLMIVYLISYPLLIFGIYTTTYNEYFSLSLFHKLCICIHPSGALITSFLVLHLFEYGNEGVQFSNLTHYRMVPDINMLMVIAMMVFSCFFYIAAIWYFDTVWPWLPGVRKPFHFFLTRNYWFGEKSSASGEIELARSVSTVDNFEDEPRSAVRSVVIEDLSKFIPQGSSSKMVLHHVSLKCYEGQITVLLGQSEAGKSSIISILAGKELPTQGSASVTGVDISKNMTRKHLGVCPQHNILHDELSVEQHLKIYAGVKGTSMGRQDNEVEQALNSLKLSSIKDEMVSDLSYSEKRKLNIAIAIVGGSKVLLLDEPTHGMDAESKKHVWDALLAIKDNHTIIVSTQSIEEADTLGDRIAVMAGGEIQSCGTPDFLKQKLGTGYHLHVQKDVKFDLDGLTSLIKKYVSTVTCETESDKEISFNLGTSNELGNIFEELDNRKTELGIISYGVSLSTLRDVLLTVSNMSHKKQNLLTEKTSTEMEDASRDSFHPTPHASLQSQFLALLLKHIQRSKKGWKYHAIQLAVPFILMLMCCSYMKVNQRSPYQPLKLDISDVYGTTDGFYYYEDLTLPKLAETFKNVLESNDVNVEKVSEPTHYVLKYGAGDLANYVKRFVVGGTLDRLPNGFLNVTAWHNSAAIHSIPMSILMMQTALLRYVANTGRISLTAVPFLSARELYEREQSKLLHAFWPDSFLPLAFTFLSLSFMLPAIREKVTKAKLLQLMSGIPAPIYWTATFLWDYLIYFIICIFMILPPLMFFPTIFVGAHSTAIGSLLLFFFLYGWASLPLGYIVSILVKRLNRGLSIFIMISLLFSVVYRTLWMNILPFLIPRGEEVFSRLRDAEWFFRLFPVNSASTGARENFQIAFYNAACDVFTPKDLIRCNSASSITSSTMLRCCKGVEPMKHLSLDNTLSLYNGPEALYLGLEGIIFFAILFLLETRIATTYLDILRFHLQRVSDLITRILLRKGMRYRDLGGENVTGDPQVLQEEERIRNSNVTRQGSGDGALVVLGLTKRFSAANCLTFSVNGGEHFGILGVNGAGKTSIFRILTGDGLPSEGDAFIQRYSLRGEFGKFQTHLGYCPEVDCLIDGLTGREMLSLFGQLRGLRGHDLQNRVNELIRSMELTSCADEPTQFYSGADKRKLSVAMALVGSPPVILLDEPTSGVDHQSRRQIWKAVTRNRERTGAAVLLATQSTEESEALCNRLAIMVNGRFHCLGSLDQLKSMYGQGYVLTFKISKEHQNNAETARSLKDFIQNSLKDATLKDEYQGRLQYHVTNPSMTVGYIFKFMSNMKTQFELEDYSVGVVSLEQPFLEHSRV